VDRLLLSEKEKQMRLNYLRKKKLLDQVSEMQEKPNITHHPVHKLQNIPIHLRKTPTKDIDDELSQRREQNPIPDPHPYEECTFKPDLSNTANKNNLQ
jgi:hypothetical protein